MKLRKIAYQLHLWIGMVSGIIVFVVCITGAIWAFKINGWTGDKDFSLIEIDGNDAPLLKPSELVSLVKDTLGVMPSYITYHKGGPVQIGNYGRNSRISAYFDPYSGTLLSDQDLEGQKNVNSDKFDFWHFIRRGHRALWLPREVGRPIVNYGTLAFVITLLTGLVLWFPKSKKAVKSRLWFNWKKGTGYKRKIFDLHTVLGFYTSFVLIALAFSGMVWGIEWWSTSLYKITSGKELPEWRSAQSDTTKIDNSIDVELAVDSVFERLLQKNSDAQSISLNFPDPKNNESAIGVTVSPENGVYYNSDRYSFDRYTLEEIEMVGPYYGKYKDAAFGDKLRRMNYDIHIGSIGGIAGRVVVFFAALFGASLPITGIYFFFIKRRKKRK